MATWEGGIAENLKDVLKQGTSCVGSNCKWGTMANFCKQGNEHWGCMKYFYDLSYCVTVNFKGRLFR